MTCFPSPLTAPDQQGDGGDRRRAQPHCLQRRQRSLVDGLFASVSSRIGHWLTQAYETAFIPADVAKYSSFGAVYPQRVMEVLQRTGPVTVQGRETLQSVLKKLRLAGSRVG